MKRSLSNRIPAAAALLVAASLASALSCPTAARAQALPSAPGPGNPFQSAPPAATAAPPPAPAPGSTVVYPSKSLGVLHTTPTLSPAGLLYNSALNDFKAGRIDSAIAKLRQFTAKYPKDGTARGLLGYLELRQGQASPSALTQASRDLAAALALDPKNQVNRGNYASALLQQKRWQDAAAQLRVILQAQPNDVTTQLRLAGALGELGRGQEAMAIYAKAVQSPGCPPFALIRYGIVVAQHRQPGTAAKLFDRAAKLEPTNGAAWNDAGICYERAGDNKNAARCLAQAVKLGPTDPFRTRFVYATALARIGQSSEAIQQFRYLTALQPNSQPAWYNLGLVNDRAGHIDDALAAYAQSRQLAPEHIPTILNTCRLLIEKGQTSDAVDILAGASQAQPKEEILHAALGAAYIAENKNVDALPQWQTAVQLDPTDSLTRARLAQLELDQQDYKDALAQYDLLLGSAPNDAGLLNGRGEALEQLKQYTDALAAFQKSVAVNPKNAVSWNNLGTVQEHLSHAAEALAAYRKAAALSPTLAEARANISRLTGHPTVAPGGIVVQPAISPSPPTTTAAPKPAAAPTPTPATAPPAATPAAPAPASPPAPQAPAPVSPSGTQPSSAPAPAAPQAGSTSGTINP